MHILYISSVVIPTKSYRFSFVSNAYAYLIRLNKQCRYSMNDNTK